MRRKASDFMAPCPYCKTLPQLWEVSFFGTPVPKFQVKCPECGTRTEYYQKTRSAVYAWNRREFRESCSESDYIDNDGLIDMLSQVIATVNKDYQLISSSEYLTKRARRWMHDLEEFINENPYMLPYDRNYVLDKMKRKAEKPRKKQAS